MSGPYGEHIFILLISNIKIQNHIAVVGELYDLVCVFLYKVNTFLYENLYPFLMFNLHIF